ncbi:MAG: FAD-dependent oxidoreductase [Chthoniobacteraceae bacterium]|nr:FAD-dependent oxidoreductase [Chthoniobacteraceae bacterium]
MPTLKFLPLFCLVSAGIAAFPLASSRAQDTPSPAPERRDICVYGETSAGVIAAVQAQKMGKSVVLIAVNKHLGGLTSGGLGFTDMGNVQTLGGMSRDYFHRIWSHYQKEQAWKFEPKQAFKNIGQGNPALNDELQIATVFEPHVAEAVFDELVAENHIEVVHGRLDLKNGVTKTGGKIQTIRLEDGRVFAAGMYIDATYEGDLMAKAGVTYAVGREPNARYKETANGIQTPAAKNQLPEGIDPYAKPGDPSSGLLPGVNANAGGAVGAGDTKIQAYCYRMCLTDIPENRVEIQKPAGYREEDYELLFRSIEKDPKPKFFKLSMLPNRKTDSNNNTGLSTDFIGMNYAYPDAGYARREEIALAHKRWQLGLVWTLQNHPRVPEALRAYYKPWGLPKDEFADNGNWSPQLYVREARRMVSDYVVTETRILNPRLPRRSVGMGSYTLDSHHVQRVVDAKGFVRNEGDVQKKTPKPYGIDYGAIVPKARECGNLLVPVCLSASHIAYGSIRMEPVFMTLGQSAATAAAQALDENVPVQKVDYAKLKARLEADQQILRLAE